MRLTVNGIERELSTPPLDTLLNALREELGITSPKAGCQQGGCGACTVLVDGEPRRSCLTPLVAVDGATHSMSAAATSTASTDVPDATATTITARRPPSA